MTLHLDTLFAYLRRAPFGGRLTKLQVEGVERLIGAWDRHGSKDDRQLAYLLATIFHETGGRMQPVRETFATSDAQAIRRLDAAMAAGRLRQVSKPYWRDGWFGRGDVQTTHERNYRKVGEAIGVDLVADPGKLLNPDVSAKAAIVGMLQGVFVPGHDLDRYFNPDREDPEGARRIINGTDKASLIAGYYRNFLDSIQAARKEAMRSAQVVLPDSNPVSPAVVAAAKPDGADLKKDTTAIGGALAGLGGIGGAAAILKPVLEGVQSPWALAAFVVVLIAAGLVLTGRVQLKARGGV
ncbi:glycoside hydrolase family 19 protein [Brevundimonas sp.]|uniref:glycoside hydrolase family 19 protein n=1 Tax=Brevundimonas sp. TaxID=1871086 RepID=UPI0035B41BAA